MKSMLAALSAGLILWVGGAAFAQDGGKLSVLCAADEAWCGAMQRAYELKSGAQTVMVRKSTGEVLDQIRREKNAPTVDVWWGGTATRICRRRPKIC